MSKRIAQETSAEVQKLQAEARRAYERHHDPATGGEVRTQRGQTRGAGRTGQPGQSKKL